MNAGMNPRRFGAQRVSGPAIGGALGLLFGVATFAISQNVLIAIAVSVPLGVTLAIAYSERAEHARSDRRTRVPLSVALVAGGILLLGISALWLLVR